MRFERVRVFLDGSVSAEMYTPILEAIALKLREPVDAVAFPGRTGTVAIDQIEREAAAFPRLLAPHLHPPSRTIDLAIVIADGCVFDLPDWIGSSRVRRWLLLRCGDAPLLQPGLTQRLPEFTPDNFEQGWESLDRPLPAPRPTPTRSVVSAAAAYHWDVDAWGFPYVEVPTVGLLWSLLPLAKVQFEQYLVAARPVQDNDWYAERLRANGRRAT